MIWTGLGRTPDEETDIPSIVVEFVSKRRRDALRDGVQLTPEDIKAALKFAAAVASDAEIMPSIDDGE